MTKHYKTPVLLIEFEGDKAFALQARLRASFALLFVALRAECLDFEGA